MTTKTLSTSRSWFFQSPEVREISANLTSEEIRKLERMGGEYGKWTGILFAGPFAVAITTRNPILIAIAIISTGYAVSLLPGYYKSLREFYCSTAYARERGFTPETLKLNSFFGRR